MTSSNFIETGPFQAIPISIHLMSKVDPSGPETYNMGGIIDFKTSVNILVIKTSYDKRQIEQLLTNDRFLRSFSQRD